MFDLTILFEALMMPLLLILALGFASRAEIPQADFRWIYRMVWLAIFSLGAYEFLQGKLNPALEVETFMETIRYEAIKAGFPISSLAILPSFVLCSAGLWFWIGWPWLFIITLIYIIVYFPQACRMRISLDISGGRLVRRSARHRISCFQKQL